MKAIINGTILTKDGAVDNHALLYTDVIEGIVPMDEVPAEATVLDAEGGYVAAGLIDLHIHGYLGRDVCDGSAQSLRIISEGLIANGVTGYLPTTMTVGEDTIRGALEAGRQVMAESRRWQGSTILGFHAEGPFVSPNKAGAQDPRHIQPPNADLIREYADVIRLVTVAPERDTADFAFVRQVRAETDVVVSMGHTEADYATAAAAIEAGVGHVTHLFNAMPPISHRAPGAVTAALARDVSCELIVDGYHVDAALYDLVWRLKGRRLCFITDCLPAGGLPEGEYTLGGQPICYDGQVCRLPNGTIAGSVLALNRGVWQVYTHSSIPLWECVNAASLNPATVLGMDHRKGSLEVGKDADIIITDPVFAVRATIIGGETRYTK